MTTRKATARANAEDAKEEREDRGESHLSDDEAVAKMGTRIIAHLEWKHEY